MASRETDSGGPSVGRQGPCPPTGESEARSSEDRPDEPCPETILIMPFAAPLCLTVLLRTWLCRRLGPRVGNLLGNLAICVLAVPPLVIAYLLVHLLRATLFVGERLQAATQHSAGRPTGR